jgi:hypothetical protein
VTFGTVTARGCAPLSFGWGATLRLLHSVIFGAAAVVCGASASAAGAADVYYVSSVTTTAPSSQWQYLDIQGYMNDVAASGILFTFGKDSPTDAGQTVLTLCDDIFHDIYVPVTYSPELVYSAQSLTGNTYFTDNHGGTSTFTATQASLLGQLVTEAQSIYKGSSTPKLYNLTDKNAEIDAIQGAIWSIEYNRTVTDPGNSAINGAISGFEHQYTALPTGGVGLYTAGGTQDQVLGITASPTPEPATWAMWFVGLLGLGAMLRASRSSTKRRGASA